MLDNKFTHAVLIVDVRFFREHEHYEKAVDKSRGITVV